MVVTVRSLSSESTDQGAVVTAKARVTAGRQPLRTSVVSYLDCRSGRHSITDTGDGTGHRLGRPFHHEAEPDCVDIDDRERVGRDQLNAVSIGDKRMHT